MVKLMDLLQEGVYDKGILKAIFMAGGPGSGKSYVAKGLFGIPEKAGITSGLWNRGQAWFQLAHR